MDDKRLNEVLRAVADGAVSPGEAKQYLKAWPYDDIGFAKLDTQRQARCGMPEAVFCQGKTLEQVRTISARLLRHGTNLLATRASEEMYRAIAADSPDAEWSELARTVTVKRSSSPRPLGKIALLCAGTADMPVAEEARITAEFLDNDVERYYDVGVAGIHRVLRHRRKLQQANVLIVVAGMEGALASVVAGIVARPVIAVPTSVGYGASFQGVAPLLTMLNSCAAGVAVVNIDNGFGAACVASLINHTGFTDE